MNHADDRQKRFRGLKFSPIALVALVICSCPIFYCGIIPVTTGQFCLDFASGHVPPKAEEMFLDRLFEATAAREYEWLATVTNERALRQLRRIQPIVTQGYTVTGGDDLGGLYERKVQFDNGIVVYLTFDGRWPCPDFFVTEREVFQRITLTHIEIRQ
jgi:hypothetical protein